MGVPRDELLLMLRALKRGTADLKSIRKALDRMAARPVGLLEALHLPAADIEALRKDEGMPDPVADRANLDGLRQALLASEQMTAAEWEKFQGTLARPTHRMSAPPLAVPSEFDGLSIQWEIVRRDRGVVFRAKDAEGRVVAVKVFRQGVPIAGDLPRVDGLAYSASPFEEGETLERRGQHGLRWVVQAVAKAADLLRTRPHGALTPAKILVRKDDQVALLGAAYARALPPSAAASLYGPGDDVRALGAILYEAVVGAPPAGEVSPQARVKDVDPLLDRVTACALSGGYASMDALADDLQRYLKGEPITARKAAPPAAAAPKRPWAWIAAAAALALIGLAAWLATRAPSAPPTAVETAEPPPAAPARPVAMAEAPKPVSVRPPAAEAPPRPLTSAEDQALQDRCLQALASGDSEQVIALSHEAVARGTRREWPFAHLVHAFTSRDALDKALHYAVQASELFPDNREFLQLRAETHAFRGQAVQALEDYGRLHGGKAVALNREIDRLSKEVQADPRDPRPRLLRGVHFHLKQHFDRAEADFDGAMERGDRRALAWRARARAGQDDVAGALRDAQAFLAERPNDYAADEVKLLVESLRGR